MCSISPIPTPAPLRRSTAFSGEAFNVGNSRGFSILEVLDVAERVTGCKIPRKLGPRRPGDPAVLVASKEKLKAPSRLGSLSFLARRNYSVSLGLEAETPHGYADVASA